ncbi:uncharacterized protein LOC112203754 [Rosa chinensis]|uniref:uncharacterized protein LOC112203754 n=1 Tax=Rosa chinensis TaxID=74649 RepID=UPI000D091475|nr:uncharacterized protein LOC112203754 [Rosa chinensis]
MVICTEIEKRKIAAHFLQGEARVWWIGTQRAMDVSTLTWEGFVVLFRYHYFPPAVREQLELEFIAIVQGNISVRDYEARFSQLYQFVPQIDAEDLAKKFLWGLKHEIRQIVYPLMLPTKALIFSSAMAREQVAKMHESETLASRDSHGKGKAVAWSSDEMDSRGGSRKRQRTHHQALARVATAPVRAVPIRHVAPAASLRCYNCGEMGHALGACMKLRNMACFRCGQAGHFAKECTRPQNDGQGNQQRLLPPGQARVFAIGQRGAGAEGVIV